MYSLIKRDDEVCYNVNEYLCDTEEDVKSLPPHCAPGSVAIVLEENNVRMFMKNSKGQWVRL